jgi:hypothetical protein
LAVRKAPILSPKIGKIAENQKNLIVFQTSLETLHTKHMATHTKCQLKTTLKSLTGSKFRMPPLFFRYAFIGDYSGQITVLRLEDSGVNLINVLKGHNGSIQTITWDGKKGWLFTGKFQAMTLLASHPTYP